MDTSRCCSISIKLESDRLPTTLLRLVLTWLDDVSLIRAAQCCRSWLWAAYHPELYTRLELGEYLRRCQRVNDFSIEKMMCGNNRTGRFSQIRFLSLDKCTAITTKTLANIAQFCPILQKLSMRDAASFEAIDVARFCMATKHLIWIDVFGTVTDTEIVPLMQHLKPDLQMYLLEDVYRAEHGIDHDGIPMQCQFARLGGCWGRIYGRIVYALDPVHGGNIPSTCIFSCEIHENQSNDYQLCSSCEELMVDNSMTGEICSLCADKLLLQNPQNWIDLCKPVVDLNLNELLMHPSMFASFGNLPLSLCSYGIINERIARSASINENFITLPSFMDHNEELTSHCLAELQSILIKARQNDYRRALLVYRDDSCISVMCDKGCILDYQYKQEFLQQTLVLWKHGNYFIYALMASIALVLYLQAQLYHSLVLIVDGKSDYLVYWRTTIQTEEQSLNILTFGAVVVMIVGSCFLVVKFRSFLERVFHWLALIYIIPFFVSNSSFILSLIIDDLHLYIDVAVFSLLCVNFGIGAFLAIVFSTPKAMYVCFLVFICAIFSMPTIIFSDFPQIALMIIFLPVATDFLAERYADHDQLPFVIPPNVALADHPLRSLLTVGCSNYQLRLRIIDLIWMSCLAVISALISNSTISSASTVVSFVIIIAVNLLLLYVQPFFGPARRPLPVLFASCLAMQALARFMPQLLSMMFDFGLD